MTAFWFMTIYLAAWLGLFAGAVMSFDRLVRLQRCFYPVDWRQAGSPWWIWSGGIRGYSCWRRCFIRRCFQPPWWTYADQKAHRLLSLY